MSINKKKIANSFSKSSGQYDRYATIQQKSAVVLANRLRQIVDKLPTGPVLEFGCGTGGFSRELVNIIPNRQTLLTDLSQGMIDKCQNNLSGLALDSNNLCLTHMDIEELSERNKYALLVSGLTLQWFQNTKQTLLRLVNSLVPGGYLLCTYIGSQSFPEWREQCNTTGLPCTVNPLPDESEINHYLQEQVSELTSWSEPMVVQFETAKDFFDSLKKTGTNTSEKDQVLKVSQMKKLLAHWDSHLSGNPVDVTYYVHTVCAKK